MVSFAKVKAGDRLYESKYETMRGWGNWEVDVISIDHENGTAVIRWNNNPAKTVRAQYFKSLRRTPKK